MADIILTAYDGAILGPIARVLGWIMNWIYVFMTDVCGIENISLTIIIFYDCYLYVSVPDHLSAAEVLKAVYEDAAGTSEGTEEVSG